MMTVQEAYLALLGLSRQMLEFAQRQDWESLTSTEAQRALLLAGIPTRISSLPQAELATIAKTIQQIQACDREVLEYVTPWREQVATLLSRLEPTTR